MSVIVRHYGLLPPLDWDEDCEEHLRRMNALWNKLVEIDREAQSKYFALFMAQYADLAGQVEALSARIDAAFEARAGHRAAHRSKTVPEIFSAQIDAMMAERAELWKQQKAARARISPTIPDQITAVELERKAAVKRARQQSRLWWSNYNAVLARYQRARARVLKAGGRFQFHPFDGSGQFVNQIQGGMSVAQLFGGGHSQVQCSRLAPEAYSHQFRGERRRRQHSKLQITVHTEGGVRRLLTFPMGMHREIPADARVKEVAVNRRRVGEHYRWTATFTCTAQREPIGIEQHPSSKACGLNLGWRRTSRGVRVCVISCPGGFEQIYLPDVVLQRATYIDELKSHLDARLDDIKEALRGWKAYAEFPDPLAALADEATRKHSAWPMSALAVAWRAHPRFFPEWFQTIEAWRSNDKFVRTEMENLGHRMLRQRREFYRLAAKRIAERYSLIAIGQLNLKAAARLTDARGQDIDLPLPARRMQRLVALSELIEWIEKQAVKVGARVEHVNGAVTQTCHACGRKQKVAAIMHACDCGEVWDQDENAARNALLFFAEPARALG